MVPSKQTKIIIVNWFRKWVALAAVWAHENTTKISLQNLKLCCIRQQCNFLLSVINTQNSLNYQHIERHKPFCWICVFARPHWNDLLSNKHLYLITYPRYWWRTVDTPSKEAHQYKELNLKWLPQNFNYSLFCNCLVFSRYLRNMMPVLLLLQSSTT